MDKYQVYFSRTTKEKYGAFSKARNDVSEILFRKGYKRIGIVSFQNYPFLIRQLVGSIYALFVLLKLPKGSVCLFQYPFDTYYRYLVFPIIRKRIKMVTIIHDIVSCRMQDGKLDKEMKFLSSFEKVVAHTDKMKQLLMENGISSSKIIVLWLFDYLVNKTPDFISYPDNSVCFAGSLRKSLFLKDPHLGELNKIQFFLYGQSAELNFPENIVYEGTFEPDDIVNIKGKWGLVWDGNSLDTCNGPMGNYLKINSSHKLSLYLAAKKPLIVWSQSALADYVKLNKLGICVDSLYEIHDKIQALSSAEISVIMENVIAYSSKLTKGKMLEKVITSLEVDY